MERKTEIMKKIMMILFLMICALSITTGFAVAALMEININTSPASESVILLFSGGTLIGLSSAVRRLVAVKA